MKSSHSGTPILSPLVEAVDADELELDELADEGADELLLLVLLLLPEQASSNRAHANDRINTVILCISEAP